MSKRESPRCTIEVVADFAPKHFFTHTGTPQDGVGTALLVLQEREDATPGRNAKALARSNDETFFTFGNLDVDERRYMI